MMNTKYMIFIIFYCAEILCEIEINVQSEKLANAPYIDEVLKRFHQHLKQQLLQVNKRIEEQSKEKLNKLKTSLDEHRNGAKHQNKMAANFTTQLYALIEDFEALQSEVRSNMHNLFDELWQKTQQNLTTEFRQNHNSPGSQLQGIYPRSCAEALRGGGTSGIYMIQLPLVHSTPFTIYCEVDPEGGDAWNIVQRRSDGSVDFYRDWQQYRQGFGNLDGEYFLGLQTIYEMTNSFTYELWIKLQDFDNMTRCARYNRFIIDSEADGYALLELGELEGNIEDSLMPHRGYKFSTKDVNNEPDAHSSCAQLRHGAWWYRSCCFSNLNGRYLYGKYTKEFRSQGITWGGWHGYQYSLKYTHMALRPLT